MNYSASSVQISVRAEDEEEGLSKIRRMPFGMYLTDTAFREE
jgi:hypothetical protein